MRDGWLVGLVLGFAAVAGGCSSTDEGGGRNLPAVMTGAVAASGGDVGTGGIVDGFTGGVPVTGGDGVLTGGTVMVTGGTPDDGTCGVSRAESQFERQPVDVVWAIDNSLSMIDDFGAVSNGLQTFSDSVASSGADLHIVMVSTFVTTVPPAVSMDTDRYLLRNVDVQSTNAYDVLIADYPNYESFLRANAATHFVVVSDFSPLLITGPAFKTQMEQLLGHSFTFHAITEPALGADYYALAMQTGGIQQPISSDWSTLYDQLQTAVVETAKLPCDVPLQISAMADVNNVQVLFTPEAAAGQQFPKALTDAACGTETAWHFDDNGNPQQVILCPSACELVQQGGGELEVVVGCEPPPILE